MKRVVVIGGGISGLAAAWAAWDEATKRPEGGAIEVLVLEADGAVGGKARTVERDGFRVEAGPTGYLDDEPVLERLVELAGLQKVPADPAAARRFVTRGGRLREVHANPLRFATSGLLSPAGLLRLAAEPWIPRRDSESDESVWEFARRRVGREFADRLIAPVALGVFAADARQLSLAAAFPRMAELEREHGSLMRAMLALKRARRKSPGSVRTTGALTSFAGGMQSLPRELARRAPFTVRTGARVVGVAANGGSSPWRVAVAGDSESVPADALVLAGDLAATAGLLAGPASGAARMLGEISNPGLAVVALGFGAEALARTPNGFGVLIPRGEGYRTLGVLWDSRLFAGRSPDGTILMRAMIGGGTDPEAAALAEHELAAVARAEVMRLFGLREPPVFELVTRWPQAIPQYHLGHPARVRAIEGAMERARARTPGLYLAGNYLHGVAFGKTAATGWTAGRRAARGLFALEPARA